MRSRKKVLVVLLAFAMAVVAVPVEREAAARAVLKPDKTVNRTYYAGKTHTLVLGGLVAGDIQQTVWKVKGSGAVKFVAGTKDTVSAGIRCAKKGTAVVTADVIMKDSTSRSYSCRITVKKPSVSVSVDKTKLNVGDTVKLSVKQMPGKKNAAVTFASSDKKVAKVGKAGKITAVSAGTATVTATLTCGTVRKESSVTITVEEPVRETDRQAVSVMDVDCAAGGIALMEDGSLLVTDTFGKLVWQVKDGVSTVYAGARTEAGAYGEPVGGYNDDTLENSSFRSPWAIAPFLDGWAISDPDNHAVRLLSKGVVRTINAKTAGAKEGVSFDRPTGLAADEEGNLYVADSGSGIVWKISTEGVIVAVAEGLDDPMGLCWKKGVLYLAETGANRIVRLADGKLETVAGSGEEDHTDGEAALAAFAAPQGVAVADDGTIYVADTCNSAIRIIRDGRVSTLLVRDRTGMEMAPMSPIGLLLKENELYICDNFSRKVLKTTQDQR